MKDNKYTGKILKMMLCVGIVFTFHLSPFTLHAQKYACVNTDYVLRSVPEYANAQKRLDKYVEDWQKELMEKQAEVDALRAEFEQESYLLPDNLKKRRQEELKAKEQEVRTLQQQRFGPGGDLDKKRAELLKPIQDRVNATIERVAQEKNYAFVFDKAGNSAVLFASKKYDISDEVLELLGYKPGASTTPVDLDESKKPSNPEMKGREPGRKNVDKQNKK
ncbi:MAG: OmpH family outer membrane protein [Bacteroidales bacterium]|nr:OmpH family outer membrane protein [Bacteroidales bacterium]